MRLGVLLLNRKGACNTGPLCGGESSPCNTMHMIRFNNAGKVVWERQVTNLTGGRGGYDDGARFVWWYQHHGRLASDGSNYAAYFGVAITVKNGSCVDVHEGDRMQVVSGGGKLVSGKGSFEVGCSHAWTSRIVWDPRAKKFVMVCATDNGCRIASPRPTARSPRAPATERFSGATWCWPRPRATGRRGAKAAGAALAFRGQCGR